MTVSTGKNAFFSAWRLMTTNSERPLAARGSYVVFPDDIEKG